MSRSVILPVWRLMIIVEPPSRREPFGASRGVKLPCRSRGTSRSTSPTWEMTVFEVNPFREFANRTPPARPSHSPDDRSSRPAGRVSTPPYSNPGPDRPHRSTAPPRHRSSRTADPRSPSDQLLSDRRRRGGVLSSRHQGLPLRSTTSLHRRSDTSARWTLSG